MDHSLVLQPLDVPSILRRYNLRPKKRLGQNFLIDDAALKRIVAAAEISLEDTILEVGPGLGSLTRYLGALACKVVAVELDSNIIPALKGVVAPYENVMIVQGDILEIDPGQLMEQPGYLVVANIPYYITSALIRHLLEADVQPGRIVLTLQREVSERICAEPGEMSLLALSVQVFGKPEVVSRIPAGAFYPSPKVDSAILKVAIYPTPVVPSRLLETFFLLTKAGFSQRRKTLRNALSSGLGLSTGIIERLLQAAEINPHRRAETLSLEEWGALSEIYFTSASGN